MPMNCDLMGAQHWVYEFPTKAVEILVKAYYTCPMKKLLILISLFALAGCASHPTLYPNAKYKKVGEAQAKSDIKECEDQAELYVKNERAKSTAKGAGSGAVMGAVIGGLFGGVRGMGRGAVGGAAVGATGGALSPKQITQRYVTRCLSEKGYEVIGYN